jgi:hypothetical protein
MKHTLSMAHSTGVNVRGPASQPGSTCTGPRRCKAVACCGIWQRRRHTRPASFQVQAVSVKGFAAGDVFALEAAGSRGLSALLAQAVRGPLRRVVVSHARLQTCRMGATGTPRRLAGPRVM